LPIVVGPMQPALYARGDVLLDDEFSRLYIVLNTRWHEHLGRQYQVLIVADWAPDGASNYPGQKCDWGGGVEEDMLVGQIELPANI